MMKTLKKKSDGDNDEDYDDPETGVPLDDSVCPPSKINNLAPQRTNVLFAPCCPPVHCAYILYIYIYIT